MALTVEGRALTESHRLAQLALAARVDRVSRSLWKRLDVSDLDGSQSRWLTAQLALLGGAYSQSQDIAGEYVDAYRRAEGAGTSAPFVAPVFPYEESVAAMLISGPHRVKAYIGKGMSPSVAHGAAVNGLTGMARRQVLAGGRMAIDSTTVHDSKAIGWRRVTDGKPCTFCAMLATRGPVYASEQTASEIAGSGLRYHAHCGCTAEIVYGEWIPTKAEQQYIDAYEAAAKEAEAVDGARTQDTVLWRMRRDGRFRDSPAKRNKTTPANGEG